MSETTSPLSRSFHTPTPSISSAFTPSPVAVGDNVWRRSHAQSISTTAAPTKPSNDSAGVYRPPHLASATGISGGEFGRRRGATLNLGPTKMDDGPPVDSWRAPARARGDSIFGHASALLCFFLINSHNNHEPCLAGHNSVATTGGWGSRR